MAPVLDPAVVERESITASVAEITAFLAEHLGRQATAYIAGVKNAAQVAKWIEGDTPPKGHVTRLRLRDAYRAARLIVSAYDDATAEAWFFGSNSRLDDEAPAWILRNARSLDDLRMVVPAAKAFARAPE